MHGVLFGIGGIGFGIRELAKDGSAVLITVLIAFLIPANLPQKDLLTDMCVAVGYVFIARGYWYFYKAKRLGTRRVKAA